MFIVTARTAKQPCVCHASAASIPCAVRNATSDLTHALYCKSSRSLHASLKKADHGSPLTERISCPPELRGNFYDRNTHIGNLPERQPRKIAKIRLLFSRGASTGKDPASEKLFPPHRPRHCTLQDKADPAERKRTSQGSDVRFLFCLHSIFILPARAFSPHNWGDKRCREIGYAMCDSKAVRRLSFPHFLPPFDSQSQDP